MAEQKGILRLDVTNVDGAFIDETVTINLKHQQLLDNRTYREAATDSIRLGELFQTPQGRYLIEVDAPSYQTVSQFVDIQAHGETPLEVKMPVDPARVTAMDRPDFSDLQPDLLNFLKNAEVPGFGGKQGKDLYVALPDIPGAGLLNLVAKARQTLLSNQQPVLSFLTKLVDLHGDRLFSEVPAELKGECLRSQTAGILHSVDDSLHDPNPGFVRAGSFKTFDHYGNLQLTLSTNPQTGQWMVDMDIDDAQGLEHVFQVVGNAISGQPTHPYNIHEILLGYQQLDPGYELEVAPTHKAMAKKRKAA